MLIINLSLLGMNIPFLFEIGALIFALILVAGYGIFKQVNAVQLAQPLLLIILCIIAAFVTDEIASFWLRTVGVIVVIAISVVSFHVIDESCTEDFKNERWKSLTSDISLISIIGMSIAQYFIASFWVFLVIYLVTLSHAYYLVVGFPSSGYNTTNLTCNRDQQSLFGINDDEI
jgi:peptidoglycan/LPS O-acetylase OafA/YrhL